MSKPILFLDDGGVMNDNIQRGTQWRRHIGEFFVPLLGGTHEAWSDANLVVATGIFEADNWQQRTQAAAGLPYTAFDRSYQLDWLGGMCQQIGIPIPAEEECIELAHRATAFVISQVRAAFPGAINTIRALYGQGYTLHTASGGPSSDLAGYLQGMGVLDCFGRLYGPDLINMLKSGPAYYQRIFDDLGISPTSAIVVDDNTDVLRWASDMGAQTVLVSATPRSDTGATYCIGSLAELPQVLQSAYLT
jgi:HAD superfamily hydrolase (TIGR01509 family)